MGASCVLPSVASLTGRTVDSYAKVIIGKNPSSLGAKQLSKFFPIMNVTIDFCQRTKL